MFTLFALSLVAGLAAVVRGRTFAGWSCRQLAWWPLGLTALAVEIALASTPLGEHPWAIQWGSAVWVGALTTMAFVLARNAWVCSSASRWAWTVAAVGVLLNITVVITNDGHMPQSQEARIAAAVSVERVAGLASEPGWRNVAPMTGETRLAWLGDVLPEPRWLPLHNVMSLGDVLLGCGVAAVLYLATTPRSR